MCFMSRHALSSRFFFYPFFCFIVCKAHTINTRCSLVVTVRSCRYGAVLRACQMAIDADLNGVIANVRNGVGHWKRMATRLARTLAEPQARSGTGRTKRRAAATSGPKYRHDRTVTPCSTSPGARHVAIGPPKTPRRTKHKNDSPAPAWPWHIAFSVMSWSLSE